ncbi:MAG: hypothetical protein ACK5MG_02180, partial [Bacteroidales bacterium]
PLVLIWASIFLLSIKKTAVTGLSLINTVLFKIYSYWTATYPKFCYPSDTSLTATSFGDSIQLSTGIKVIC